VLAFDPDVGRHLRSADLVVSRAGAMATSEILAFGRPALFIPYPFAGGHQRDNAEPLARRRAAWLREESALTGESLGTLLRGLLADREGLRRTGERAKAQAAPRASAEVFERIRAAVSRRA
jgi:UDP-N-acetylglucosamine--N-acetylmuramyl-(pentapeptide) pyrophosphoryl-undecaprenol N-acetylglucosamine transferase